MPTLPRIIVILGPTAAGKTDLSLDLAERLGGEIISADSMQVYRRMDIGTAKLPPEQRRGIPHHLLDICDPTDYFSVADFRHLAAACLADISGRGLIPIITGGTGLYIDSLLKPYNFTPIAASDPQLRELLKRRLEQEGSAVLHRELAQLDPAAAARIHPNDTHRLIRALEVGQSAGRAISDIQQEKGDLLPYAPLRIGITMEREQLYRRIEQRVDIMLEQGLVKEVSGLLDSGVPREATSMQGLGYRQLAAYLCGEIPFAAAIEQLKRDTRRFAKRQLTWFKRDPDINWLQADHYREAGALMRDALRLIG